MGRLADHVSIRALAARSVNLERDSGGDDLAGYVPTARAIDTLRRVLEGLSASAGNRAWSITGPYGSGKSSFALLLDALCGPPGPMRDKAAELLESCAPDVVKVSWELADPTNGLIRATTLAGIEPVAQTVARALQRGLRRRWPTRAPRDVQRGLTELARRIDLSAIREVIDAAAGYAPVLVVIDEFGKNLEYHAGSDPGALYLLQELAEFFSGSEAGRAGGVITLQHLAFEDYASSLSATARREWAKVQGRFEDITFIDAPDQVVRLVADTIRHEPATRAMARRLEQWSSDAAARVVELGLLDYFGTADVVGQCYPIHPVAAAALPDLCSRYGQYERTLVSFLASGEQDSVVRFCASAPDSDPLPTVGLAEVYDYFVTAARTLTGAAAGAARWLEIESRINDALVDDDDLTLLKVIGALNLVGGNGPLRASAAMVVFAADVTTARAAEIRRRLSHLAERGVITYRSFADEYRLWHGTDFDVSGAIAESRELLSGSSPAELLSDATSPEPVIAGRHSQQTGILRYFDVAYADAGTNVDLTPSPADGTVVYVVSGDELPGVTPQDRPVVYVVSDHTDEPIAAALELAAINAVLREHATTLGTDWVARRELHERAAQARVEVSAKLSAAFDPTRVGVTWAYQGDTVTSRRGASGALSIVCERVFCESPIVRNEMVARRELTSQGAKARRMLMEAMIAAEPLPLLGFDGFGPERAIYHAVLEEPGFHRMRGEGDFRFGPPFRSSTWMPVWKELQTIFTDAEAQKVRIDTVYTRLTSRPYGLKPGVIPILLAVGLLHRRDDMALYEEGTYQPRLSADLLERLVKNPDRFALKNFAAHLGQRRNVIERLASALHIEVRPTDRRRNASIVSLMNPLLAIIRELPPVTMTTRSMSEHAVAVRDALLRAREPDEVLFRDLPVAVGVDPSMLAAGDAKTVRTFASRVAAAVRELQGNWGSLLARIEDQLRSTMGTPQGAEVRTDLSVRARHLVDRVLDPRLRAFLLTVADNSLDHDDWVDAVALTVLDKPVRSWKDQDWPAFLAATSQLGGTLKRLEALNYEHIAQGSTEFSARRFTITNPDGTETSTVVVTDPQTSQLVEALVTRVLKEAKASLPEAALPALLAGLTDELLRATDVVSANAMEEGRRALG
ncbi:MAG: hypothetical protein ACYDEY_05555 [Acidimicrobiales bacterium]